MDVIALSFALGFLYMTLRGYEVKLITSGAKCIPQFGWSFITALVNGFIIFSVAQDIRIIPVYAAGWATGAVIANKLPVFHAKKNS